MKLSQLPEGETLLLRRLEDLCRIADTGHSPRFSSFLNERESLVAGELIRQRRLTRCRLYGGYPDAARVLFGAFPESLPPKDKAYPIAAVSVHLPKGAQVSHRDVLGSLMSLQIKREGVGDILIREGRCDVFLLPPVARLALDELTKIGGVGVRCEAASETEFIRSDSFESLRGTVKTPRADAVVALLTGLSREKSADLIRADLVQINHMPPRVAELLAPSDVLSIRGYGKFILDEIGSPTKKGRLPLLYRRYR